MYLLLEVLVALQELELLSLPSLPIKLLPGLVGLNGGAGVLDWLRVLVVVMVLDLSALVMLLLLLLGLGVWVVVIDVSEGVLQGLEPSEVLVSLGLPVSTLGTVLVQNAIKCRSTHFNNLNQTKLLA